MDPTTLAKLAVDTLKPALVSAGSKMAVDSLLGWLKSKFTKPAQTEALEEVIQAPNDAGALESLQLQVRRLIEQDCALIQELLALLPKDAVTGISQSADVQGDGNLTIQSTGSGTISVNRG